MPAYQVVDAAKYARVTRQTILNWQNAKHAGQQVIAMRDRGASLSYLQLVELAFVAELRKAGVKLSDIKNARAYISAKLKTEFPFADVRFKTDGQDILMELGEFSKGKVKDKLIKVNKGGQIAWAPIIKTKFTEFEYQDRIAVKWHVDGLDSPVSIDPRVSFGAPMVKGVATWAIKGRYESGESLADIAEDFALDKDEVNFALKFEGIDPSKLKAWH